MTVSVLIPAYQAAAFIERTLRCASEQTHEDLRILVSVDRSGDDTEALCRRHAADDPRIEVVPQSERLGWVGNVNFLLDQVTSEFAFLYFHDDLIKPTYCERLVSALTDRPDAASAHCDVGHFGATDKVFPGRALDGPAFMRVLSLLTGLGPSMLRSMIRTSRAGHVRLPVGVDGIWANEPFILELATAGPALHVPDVLYSRWDYREGGLTAGWLERPFDDILAGYRANAELSLRMIEDLRPSAEERQALVFGLFIHSMRGLRRAEERYGAERIHPPEVLLPDFAGMTLPPAIEALPAILRSQCERAFDQYLIVTGQRASDAGNDALAAGAYRDLATRHPDRPRHWRRLAGSLRRLGRADEAREARKHARVARARQQ